MKLPDILSLHCISGLVLGPFVREFPLQPQSDKAGPHRRTGRSIPELEVYEESLGALMKERLEYGGPPSVLGEGEDD
eukprot:CCRYP_003363-RB/>CCRYP_003363-RB protein AED:0.48 eAED:1.00 QI:0/0/0/1/0/0/2/0/76